MSRFIHGVLERRTSFLGRWKSIDAFLWIENQTMIFNDLSRNNKLGKEVIIELKNSKIQNVVDQKGIFAKELFAITTENNEVYIFRTKNEDQKIEWLKGLKQSKALADVFK